ncbi:virulence factor SrfC family protein [Ewingella americana]|uniref:Virulence factor n=1 Tax=Ewingella americana TaxID=41202 RepID=A0A502G8R0_9GAMM|nr:virulence factor SrfC family protein [Ewingella americana]TPG58299.1 virulence factor [Ewingella americana]
MNSKKPEHLAGQFHAIVHGVDQAMAWMEENRVTSPRLHMEADRLKLKLRRQRYKSHHLGITASQNPAIGLYGQAQSGKAHLLNAMVAAENGRLETLLGNHVLDYLSHINPGDQACGVITRFSRQSDVLDPLWPVQLALLSEADLIKIAALNAENTPVQWDPPQILAHLQSLAMHRQPEPVDGLTGDDVVALWDAMTRADAKKDKPFALHFWPAAVDLAPYLSVDDRARLFSVLWNEAVHPTAFYRHFAHTLQQLSSAAQVLAPLGVLVDDHLLPADGIMSPLTLSGEFEAESHGKTVTVRPLQHGVANTPVEITLVDLTLLSVELLVPLMSAPQEALFEQVDLLTFPADVDTLAPGRPHSLLSPGLLHAKNASLLERYTDSQQVNLLMVCTAAGSRDAVKRIGKALDYWVKQTQGENAQVRSRRKPGLIWALTPFDQRITHSEHFDEAVQRYVGTPGDAWGTMLAMDKRGIERMAAWLSTEVTPQSKQKRVMEQLEEVRRELADNLLGSWHQPAGAEELQQKQRIAESLLKALQTRAGVHGELLERLLPAREELRRLYLQQFNTPQVAVQKTGLNAPQVTETFGIGISIDLFSEEPVQAVVTEEPNAPAVAETDFARKAQHHWINHLRSLPDNAPLVDLLGIGKPGVEMLVEEVITAGIRMDVVGKLVNILEETPLSGSSAESQADRQVSRALTVMGDFVAWLGFLNIEESQRPDSRINRGHKIFAKPPKTWSTSQRLTKLTLAPVNNTAFYIYDWLVALNEIIIQNTGYSAGREISAQQKEKLREILQGIKG